MMPQNDNPANENRVSHAMSIDDAYRVEQTLARSARGITELVTLNEAGPFIRKKIPRKLVHRAVWASLGDCGDAGLPRIQAMYETPDWFMVVHDYLPGKTLEAVLAEGKRFSVAEATDLMGQLCNSVADLHTHRIIHRDISPANVLVSESNNERHAYLIDFGNARMMHEQLAPDDATQGTWGFAAPEQHGFAQADERSDVYSLGRLLGFMLTGIRPGDSNDDSYLQHLADPAIVPPRLRAVLDRACAFEPSARFQDATTFSEALREAARPSSAQNSHDQPASQPEPPTRPQSAPIPAPTYSVASTSGATQAAVNVPSSVAARPKANRTLKFALLGIALVTVVCLGATTVISALHPDKGSFNESGFSASTNNSNDAGSNLADSLSDNLLGIATDSYRNGTGDTDSSQDASGPAQLELVESGWSPGTDGFINYAFAIRNPSSTETIDYPEVVITGRAADGSVVFSHSQVLFSIGPGETQYFGGPAGNGTAPDTVEFALGASNDFDITEADGARATFGFSPVSEVSSGMGGSSFTGELTMSDGAVPELANNVAVIIVLRDESGSIVYGCSTFISMPEPGRSAPFECDAFGHPDYAIAEAHALFW